MEWTFRDPAGQLRLEQFHALRRIHPSAEDETLDFLASPLRAALERSGSLIETEIARPPQSASNIPQESSQLWLKHPLVDPISYPWEWTTAQWRAAAELTLQIASRAVDAGWMLKDAAPLNILFVGTRPILVDVLSFERRHPHASDWLAYGQFVRTFLLPLVAEKLLDWPLQATVFVRDGYEPRTLYRALKPWQRFYPGLLDVVTLATLLEGSGARKVTKRKTGSTTDPELATHILQKRIVRLGKQVRSFARTETRSEWSEYQHSAVHYRPDDSEEKERFVSSVLERCRPKRVLDIGANTGTYSIMAAKAGAEVVALDSDAAAIEALWRKCRQKQHPVTALVANIARPTPAVGWRNQEQHSLLERLEGKFDLMLMLAVIHHLILREQLPLAHIGDLCASLTRRWLVLEWVPVTDPMYQEWLRGRDEIYGRLCEVELVEALAPHFRVVDRTVLGNQRVLLLFERIGADDSTLKASPAW
jgi:SAM-dependent methyltransferase